MSPIPDHYRVLQVDPEADPDVVTAAYRALARRLHPDRDVTGVQQYRMSELNRAYAVLRDPEKRRAYDRERALAMQPMGPGQEPATPSAPGGLAARVQAAREAAASAGSPGDNGETRLAFGRYAGMTLREIAGQDADYLRWLARHSSGLRYRDEIGRVLDEPLGSYAPRASR